MEMMSRLKEWGDSLRIQKREIIQLRKQKKRLCFQRGTGINFNTKIRALHFDAFACGTKSSFYIFLKEKNARENSIFIQSPSFRLSIQNIVDKYSDYTFPSFKKIF